MWLVHQLHCEGHGAPSPAAADHSHACTSDIDIYMSQMLYSGQSAREIVTFLVTFNSFTGHSSCTRSMKF